MINGINDALLAVRRSLSQHFVITKTYYGKAYKHESPEGIIGYRLNLRFTNSFGLDDEKNYFLLHRRTFWSGWAQHCGLSYNPNRAMGLTISYEIYNDMKADKSTEPKLLITNENHIHMYSIGDIVQFVESHNTLVKNQNHGFMEVGMPVSIKHELRRV